MSGYVEKTALLTPPVLEEDDVTIAKGKVRVRALTRFEAGQVQKRTDTDAKDRITLTYGMVTPNLTEAEAGEWMRTDKAGDLVKVTTRIAELSGLLEASGTDAYKSDGDGSKPGV